MTQNPYLEIGKAILLPLDNELLFVNAIRLMIRPITGPGGQFCLVAYALDKNGKNQSHILSESDDIEQVRSEFNALYARLLK